MARCALTVANGVLYVGGDFSDLRGSDRGFGGAVAVSDGGLLDWDPAANGVVRSIVAAGHSVYLGGEFTSLGMIPRNRIAELAPASSATAAAQVRPWNPSASDRVLTMAFQGGQLAAAGAFRSIGGVERRYLASISKLTGRPTDWKPVVNGEVRALKATGRTIFAGGGFTSAGGQTRLRAAAWDIGTGQLISWNPEITDDSGDSSTGVDAMEIAAETVYLGGRFTHIGGVAHANLGGAHLQTGMPVSWSAHPNDKVRALKSLGNHLYIGGEFDRVNGQTIAYLARVALDTRLLEQSWNARPNNSVFALEGKNGVLYAGGSFRTFEGSTILQALAAIDVSGADPVPLTGWNPRIFADDSFRVNALRIVGDNLYVGGRFGQAGGGQIRENLAAFDLAGNGQPNSWNPNANREVYALIGSGNSIYAGGAFTAVAGQVHPHFAAFTLADAPVVTGEPADLVLAKDFEATAGTQNFDKYQLNVAAMGAGELTYQWFKNGQELTGEMGTQLVITRTGDPVQVSDAGVYHVVVRNAEGTAYSREARVTVLEKASIVQNPAAPADIQLGDDVTLSVVATGGQPLSYQWLVNGTPIEGAKESVLQLNSISGDQAGAYRVIVSNPVGSVTSGEAVIELNLPTDVVLSDDFADRLTLVGKPSGTARADNSEATVERSGGRQEPRHGGKAGGHSLWFTWKAPASGVATFDTRGSDIDTVLAVYTGTDLNALTMVRDADDHKDDDDNDADDDAEDKARKRRTFFAESLKFEAVAGSEYQVAIDGYNKAIGNVVVNWSLNETGGDLPVIVEDSGELDSGGNRSLVAKEGERVELRILGYGVKLNFNWYHNGNLIPDAHSTIYVIDRLTPDTVGEYQAEAFNQDGSHHIRSKKFVVEIGMNKNANTVNKLQDLDRAQGQQGRSGFGRPQNLIPVSAGALGTQVANNARSSTQEGELRIANQLGGSSRWLQLKVEQLTTLTVDTIGSEIDTLLAVYIPPQGVALDDLKFADLDFVDSDDDGAPDNLRSRLADLPVSAQEYLIVVDGKNGATGEIKINYRLGVSPEIDMPGQPVAGQEKRAGETATFSVTATGTPREGETELDYEWRFNGEPIDPIANPSAATATLSLSDLLLSHSGNYTVRVSNHMGEVTSQISKLTVTEAGEAPAITQQPAIVEPKLFVTGDNVTFTVAASGDPAPTYRWRKGGMPLADGGRIAGSGTEMLTISTLDFGDSGSYDVVVNNPHGNLTSLPVALDVGSIPVLTTEPQSQSVCAGGAFMLTAAATGTPAPMFIWRKGTTVLTETGPTLTIDPVTPADAGVYTVEAKNDRGSDVSAAATLTVTDKPEILAQPALIRVDKGKTAMLEIETSGATSLQWFFRKKDTDPWTELPEETSALLTIGNVQPSNAGEYKVEAVNGCGLVESAPMQLAIKHLSNPNFANGKFGFNMDGEAGDVWIFQVSTDLKNWSEAGRVTLDASGVPVSVSADPGMTYATTLTILGGRVVDNASTTTQGARMYRILKP